MTLQTLSENIGGNTSKLVFQVTPILILKSDNDWERKNIIDKYT